jgi:hypothetical protein
MSGTAGGNSGSGAKGTKGTKGVVEFGDVDVEKDDKLMVDISALGPESAARSVHSAIYYERTYVSMDCVHAYVQVDGSGW